MKFFNAYNKPKPILSDNIDYETKIVQQSEADVCGLKYQLERYGMNSLMAKFEQMKSKFGYADCRNIPDFEKLQNRVAKGVEYFNNLPSEIRAKFNNKPAAFYQYIQDHPVESVKDGYIDSDTSEYIKSIYPDKFKSDISESVQKAVGEVVPTSEPVLNNEENVTA